MRKSIEDLYEEYVNSKEYKYDLEEAAETLVVNDPSLFYEAVNELSIEAYNLFNNADEFIQDLREGVINYWINSAFVEDKVQEEWWDYQRELMEANGEFL